MHECERKVHWCLFANRLSFSELFDDISLKLNVGRLCAVVIMRGYVGVKRLADRNLVNNVVSAGPNGIEP